MLSLNPDDRPSIATVKRHPFMWGEVNVPALALGDVEIPKVLVMDRTIEKEKFLWKMVLQICADMGMTVSESKSSSSFLSSELYEAPVTLNYPKLEMVVKYCRRCCSLCADYPKKDLKLEHLPIYPSTVLEIGNHALPSCFSCNMVVHLELKKGHSWSFHKLYFRFRNSLNVKFEELEVELFQNLPFLEESHPVSHFKAKKIRPRTLHMRELSLLFKNLMILK
ncbi:hypothetical protein GEMRC1_011380 [Eukaryota sp. GEM-RC1]